MAVSTKFLTLVLVYMVSCSKSSGNFRAIVDCQEASAERKPCDSSVANSLYEQYTYDYMEGKGMCVGISVPHEGDRTPLKYGRFASRLKRFGAHVLADNTEDLGWMIWQELKGLATTGKNRLKYPFYLKNKIDRVWVDMNRPPPKCPGRECEKTIPKTAYRVKSKDAEKAYNYFHDKAKLIRNKLQDNCTGGALWLDIHGQQRTQKWMQVGYGISAEKIQNPSELLNQLKVTTKGWGGTINGVYARQRTGKKESEKFATSLVMGTHSFSKIMDSLKGSFSSRVRAGPAQGTPKIDNISLDKPLDYPGDYLTGGFIVQKYGSCACCRAKQQMNWCEKDGTNTQSSNFSRVDAVQLEFPTSAVQQPTQRRAIAKQVAKAVLLFFQRNGNQQLYY